MASLSDNKRSLAPPPARREAITQRSHPIRTTHSRRHLMTVATKAPNDTAAAIIQQLPGQDSAERAGNEVCRYRERDHCDDARARTGRSGKRAVYPARRKLWRASSCLWPSQIFVPSSAEL